MENRTKNGRPLDLRHDVVAVDAIARLSGVTGKDVVKVLLAIHAIEVATQAEVRQIVNIDNAPTAPADEERFANTVQFVDALIHKLQKAPLRPMLNILSELGVHRRFRRGRPDAPTIRSVCAAAR